MCVVCIANNIYRNVYMYLNTRIFPTSGYARVLLLMFIRRELGGTGTGCLFQFTYCVSIWQQSMPATLKNVHCIHKMCFATFFLLLWCVDLPNRGECSVFSSVVRGNLENYSEPRRNFTLYARLVPHVDKAPLPLRILRLVTSNFLPVEIDWFSPFNSLSAY